MDHVFVEGLRLEGHHGVGEQERAQPQPFVLDVSVFFEGKASDDLSTAFDYDLIVKEARDVVEELSFKLVESIAEEIAIRLLAHPLSKEVRVRIAKVEPPIDAQLDSVGVEIYRTK